MKTVVVGAGPVGALAAIYAAQRGHQVEIYEWRNGKLYISSFAWQDPFKQRRNPSMFVLRNSLRSMVSFAPLLQFCLCPVSSVEKMPPEWESARELLAEPQCRLLLPCGSSETGPSILELAAIVCTVLIIICGTRSPNLT